MSHNSAITYSKYFLLFLLFGSFVYIAIRAWTISFTHDESLTYTIITGNSQFKDSANNHLLNTFLASVCSFLFGISEFSLRLPNVIAFALYLYFTYKIVTRKNKIMLMLLGTVLLLSNSYLLDYFSLCRGYGLAVAFSLAALYFLFERSFDTYDQYKKNLCLALGFSILAAYSNLIYINLNIAIIIVFGIELFCGIHSKRIQLDKSKIATLAVIFSINMILLSFLVSQLLMLKANNQLYYGGNDGFIHDTVLSLIHISFVASEITNSITVYILIILFTISIIYSAIIRNKKITSLSKSVLILNLMIFASVFQHIFLDSLYPVYRTALVFIPLFALLVFYLFSEISTKNRLGNIAVTIVAPLLTIPLLFFLCNTLSFHQTKEWAYDSHTKEMMLVINQQNTSTYCPENSIIISNLWFFAPTINYYRDLFKMHYLTKAEREGINKNSEYIFTLKDDLEKENIPENYATIFNQDDIYLFQKR